VLVLAPTPAAGSDLLRGAAAERGASFGWHRATVGRLASEIASIPLAESGRVPAGRLACVALVTRVVQDLARLGQLGRYAEVSRGPTFARAAAGVLSELRLARLAPEALDALDPGLAALARAYESALAAAGLIDRAGVLALAARVAGEPGFAHPWLGLPTLLLDLPLADECERALAESVWSRAPDALATCAAGDERATDFFRARVGVEPKPLTAEEPASSLAKLQVHLFEDRAPPPQPHGEDVVVLSAPGESRECVEIARRLLRHARAGVPFDRMAILLRSVEEYRPHLEEALRRAGVPAYFARGATRPDPAGRALLALLGCRTESYSARRFAEYLSLGEVPPAGEAGAPPPAASRGDRWVAPDEELVPDAVAAALETARADGPEGEGEREEEEGGVGGGAPAAADPDAVPVTDGTLRAPRHWERLLVEAAVIGGRDRWERRLGGLAATYRIDLEEADELADYRARDLAALESLRDFAMPLLDALEELPERADWGEWLDALSSLASRALRHPDRVLSVLAELAPMAGVGPVDLAAVRFVLSERLLELSEALPPSRHGRVFVAPAEAARGMAFDVVCVPGLAERLFPRKISEEPLLLDVQRAKLPGLRVQADRVHEERMALRLAVGAASRALVLSYPRLDLDQSRPRVPSFYALEALRAAEGRLPGFDELASKAEGVTAARVGWPAPESPADAIDETEYDLALRERRLGLDEQAMVGTARFLLTANPHLGRALRFRARRWLPRWTEADGLTPHVQGDLAPGAREAMAAQRLGARSYSPTALQSFSKCPYKFFLYAVHRLGPREDPEAIDEMDPLQRGSLVHEVQYELFRDLSEAGLLPVTPERLAAARGVLEDVVDRVAERYRDDLAPAIERVWDDGIHGVRADLREWLRRTSEDASGFVPWRFELSFGLPARRDQDPSSLPDPVALENGLRLRGSIDLVERTADGRVRVTDHKTGKVWVEEGGVIAGGESLQPILYALAAEKLLPDDRVESGRLYYCTAAGGFEEREVPLDDRSRRSAAFVAEVVDGSLKEPFLPAAPADGACRFCDYRIVCGPYEEQRTARKWKGHEQIQKLQQLREAR